MELFKASNQWATRPSDERFWDLNEMQQACEGYKQSAQEVQVKYSDLRFEADGSEIFVSGKARIPAKLTNWAFGQVCQKVNAPASYLRTLPSTLAVQNLNHGFTKPIDEEENYAKLMFHKNGSLVLRAATSLKYKRVWNADIISSLQRYVPMGWQVPPARPAGVKNERTRIATSADVLRLQKGGLSINEGDTIAPAGLYASDHDMFVFMVNETNPVNDGTGHGLGRGFFLWNSEVGAASVGVMSFLYDAVCGNHIVWGAKNVEEVRIRHIGNADTKAFSSIRAELISYANSSVSDLEAQIRKARAFEFAGPGASKEAVVEAVIAFAVKAKAPLSQKIIADAYDVAVKEERYGSPRSAWAIANGLTELSQECTYTDERIKIDRAAGKVLEMVF